MGLKEILKAARADIGIALGVEDDGPLDAKNFAKVLFIAKRAEGIACAEGRGDELVVQNQALRDLEGKAPLTCAALTASLTGGDLLVAARLRELEADRQKVLEASRELQNYESRLGQHARALGSGSAPMLSLGSGDKPTEPAPEGETHEAEFEDAEDIPPPPRMPALDLPRDAEAVADAEIEGENEKRKTHPDQYRL